MGKEIFDDLRKKSEEIMQSNEALKGMISNFNQELTRMKTELEQKEGSEQTVKQEIG
ncbi:TPA: hypothetical protein HA265_06660, partial [Candidatus Woesearchaeota archaeon]|nr:hypothetical protein [Candidatus Woesearchaeota archaeon]